MVGKSGEFLELRNGKEGMEDRTVNLSDKSMLPRSLVWSVLYVPSLISRCSSNTLASANCRYSLAFGSCINIACGFTPLNYPRFTRSNINNISLVIGILVCPPRIYLRRLRLLGVAVSISQTGCLFRSETTRLETNSRARDSDRPSHLPTSIFSSLPKSLGNWKELDHRFTFRRRVAFAR